MPKKSRTVTTIIIIGVCLAIVYGVKMLNGASKSNLSTAAKAKIKGNDDAPLKITEFIDFQCPACAKGSQYLMQQMKQHPDLIRLQLKHFPLTMHKHGIISAQYAECAAQQGKFWPFHDLVLERQGNWKRLADAQPAFDRIAREIKLSSQQLSACLIGGKANKVIEKNKTEGQSLKIRSTPTYFVNGKMVVGQKYLAIEINKYLSEHGD